MNLSRRALVLLVVAVAACKPEAGEQHTSAPSETKEAVAALDAADSARCNEGAAYALAPLTVEWQQGDAVHRLVLGSDGRVSSDGAPFGRFQGACLLDAQGRIKSAVDAKGLVTDRGRSQIGKFLPHAPLQIEGKNVPVTETWVHPDGEGMAVDDEGTVYVVPRSGEAFTLPAGVEGGVSQARRAALLLLAVRPGFGRQ
jgi:hypothetical protein